MQIIQSSTHNYANIFEMCVFIPFVLKNTTCLRLYKMERQQLSKLLPLRRCQLDALDAFEQYFYENDKDKGILSACCGFGKTRLCYELVKKCFGKGETRFIIATSRVKLLTDAVKKMKNWFKLDNTRASIYRVGGDDGNISGVKKLKDKQDIYT